MKPISMIKTLCLAILLTTAPAVCADNSPMDDDIINVIQSELTLDEDLDSLDVTVTSHNGVVELRGEVDSNESKNHIIDIAQSTAGVVKVYSSKLTVNPN